MHSVVCVVSADQRQGSDHGQDGGHDHESWCVLAFARVAGGGRLAAIADDDLAKHVHGDVGLTGVVEGGVLGERVVESDVGCGGPGGDAARNIG